MSKTIPTPADFLADGDIDGLLAFHRARFGDARMEADAATPDAGSSDSTPAVTVAATADDQPLGEGGVKALAAEREARKALEQQVADIKKQGAELEQQLLALLGVKPEKGEDAVETLKKQVSTMQRDLTVERIAREKGISDERHLALLAKQPDADSMRDLADVLSAKTAGPPSPQDAGIGTGGASAHDPGPGVARLADAFDKEFKNL